MAQEQNKRNSQSQSDKIKRGVHNFQVYARKMLEAWGVEVPEGGDMLTIHQRALAKWGKQNFQFHMRNKLREWGVEVQEGDNVQNIHQRELAKKGENNFQDKEANKKQMRDKCDASTNNFQNLIRTLAPSICWIAKQVPAGYTPCISHRTPTKV